MKQTDIWVIYLVAFDDETDAEHLVDPYVGKERVASTDEAEMAAFLRGGTLAATVRGTDAEAEQARIAIESEVLRR